MLSPVPEWRLADGNGGKEVFGTSDGTVLTNRNAPLSFSAPRFRTLANETPRPPSSARKTVCFEFPVPPFRESPGHLLAHAPPDYRSPSVAGAFLLFPATISHGNRLTPTRETCSAMAIWRSSLHLSFIFPLSSPQKTTKRTENKEKLLKSTENKDTATEE